MRLPMPAAGTIPHMAQLLAPVRARARESAKTSSLARWSQTIATRTAYLAIERRKPTAVDLEVVEEEIVDKDPDQHRITLARAAAKRLYAALEKIDAKQRVAFALAVIDGLPLAEVAELTESSLVATKTRVWRCRRDLMRRAKKDPVLASYLADLGGAE